MSQETQSGRWIGFRQPVLRVAPKEQGKKFNFTYEAHEAAGRRSLGRRRILDRVFVAHRSRRIARHSETFRVALSTGREDHRLTNTTGGFLKTASLVSRAAAAKQNLTPLEYMRKYGAFVVEDNVYNVHETAQVGATWRMPIDGAGTNVIAKNGKSCRREVDGAACAGFPTPRANWSFIQRRMKDWKWPEYAIPAYIKSHVHPDNIDHECREMLLVPTFRLPTLIHTRSGNAKWLYEISHRNPLWINPKDAENLDFKTGDLLGQHRYRLFRRQVWVTEGISPASSPARIILVVGGCRKMPGGERWSTALVDLKQVEPRQMDDAPHSTASSLSRATIPDSERIFWEDGGVHQNLTFPVHPDSISGMHCWHQKVRVDQARRRRQYGDVFVDTNKSHEVYKEWLENPPRAGAGQSTPPLWLPRSYKPAPEAYYLKKDEG